MKGTIAGSRIEMRAKWGGKCRRCGRDIHVGAPIYYFPKSKAAEHDQCTRNRTATRPDRKETRRRACPSHGWLDAVRHGDKFICPRCGQNTLTERQWQLLQAARNKRRLLGEEE